MKKFLLLFTFVTLTIASCIPSVHPLVTPDVEIQFDKVIGVYEMDGEIWKFSKTKNPDRSEYLLEAGESKEELKPHYLIHFAEFNNMVFADFYPTSHSDLDFGEPDYIAMHTFVRVDLKGDRLSLRYSDMDELKKLFREGKVRLKHERMEDGNILITASPKQLQKFISQHGSNDVFFGIDQELKRISSKIDAGE
jgi:hypothetical protein